MALWKSFAKVGGATIVSRALGFIRDAMIAGSLGAGPVADAFVVAFRLPNLFRRLFAEGVFNSAFVPLYGRILATEGEDGASKFAGEIASGLIAALVVVVGMSIFFASWLVEALAHGFAADPEKFALTVSLTRLCLPYLACMSMVAFLGAILAAHRRYLASALAPIVLNIVMIGALLFIDFAGFMRTEKAGYILTIGVTLSGVCQLAMVAIALHRAGIGFPLRVPALTGSIRQLMVSSLPALIGGGITQINIVVGTAIASIRAGTVSDLYYADRVYQLPLGVIGIAIGVVLLPELLHRIRMHREDLAMESQNRSLELALALTLPASVGLIVAAHPIVEVLFERGAFGPRDTDLTATALIGFAAGLPAFVAVKVLTAAFFARLDLKTPMWAGLIAVVVNLALALALFGRLGGTGIALATSTAGWINAAVLWMVLLRRRQWRADGPLEHRLPRLAIASLAMGLIVWILRETLDVWLGAENAFIIKLGSLAIVIGMGMGTFLAVAIALGGIDLASIRAGLRGTEPKPDDPLIAAVAGD